MLTRLPFSGKGKPCLVGLQKGARWEGEEDVGGERWGQDTDLHVRAMLSSAKVPPGCAVTQASLRLYLKQRPPWEKHRPLVLFFHFNG